MATPTYGWNPFQARVSNRVTNEIIKPSTTTGRYEFVPRAAPFFSRNFELYRQGVPTPLVLGTDYVFAHSFDRFISQYKRNCFGSVVLLKDFGNDVLISNYDTIGGPFMVDDAAFATLVANIINNPRQADWDQLDLTVPEDFPADPHEHPVAQTYDYEEMMVSLRSLILALTNNNQGVDTRSLLEEHMSNRLSEAHTADSSDVGLDFVQNMGPAYVGDLVGNSSNKLVTVAVLKEAFRQQASGTLDIN